MGSVLPEELSYLIHQCDFGLIWDGDSVEECSGDMGTYLLYNAPYKASLYIASGLPVLFWNKMGISAFIKEKNAGIPIVSLNDLSEVIGSLSQNQINNLNKNTLELSKDLISGNQYRKCIESILENIK